MRQVIRKSRYAGVNSLQYRRSLVLQYFGCGASASPARLRYCARGGGRTPESMGRNPSTLDKVWEEVLQRWILTSFVDNKSPRFQCVPDGIRRAAKSFPHRRGQSARGVKGVDMNRKLTFVLALIVFLMMGMTAFADSDFDGVQVPEPSSIVVLSIGLAAVAYAAWRRNHKK